MMRFQPLRTSCGLEGLHLTDYPKNAVTVFEEALQARGGNRGSSASSKPFVSKSNFRDSDELYDEVIVIPDISTPCLEQRVSISRVIAITGSTKEGQSDIEREPGMRTGPQFSRNSIS